MTFRLRPNAARMCCGHASGLATSERSSTGAVWNRPSDASFRARRASDWMSPVVQASCRGAMHHGCFSLRPSPPCGEDNLLRRAVETLDAVSVMLTRPRLLRDDSGSRPAFSLHYQVHSPQRPKSNDSGCPVSLPRHTRRRSEGSPCRFVSRREFRSRRGGYSSSGPWPTPSGRALVTAGGLLTGSIRPRSAHQPRRLFISRPPLQV